MGCGISAPQINIIASTAVNSDNTNTAGIEGQEIHARNEDDKSQEVKDCHLLQIAAASSGVSSEFRRLSGTSQQDKQDSDSKSARVPSFAQQSQCNANTNYASASQTTTATSCTTLDPRLQNDSFCSWSASTIEQQRSAAHVTAQHVLAHLASH